MRLLDIVPVPLSFVTFIFVCLQCLAAITTKISAIVRIIMIPAAPAAPAAAAYNIIVKPLEGALLVVDSSVADKPSNVEEVELTLEAVTVVVVCSIMLFVTWGGSVVAGSTAGSVSSVTT